MRFYKGLKVILIVCLVVAATYAQEKPRLKNEDRSRERDLERQRVNDMASRENALHLLDRMREFGDTKEDTERFRREEILRNLQKLQENNEKLFFLSSSLDEKRFKDAASLANKVANASKDLRKNLDLKGKKDSNNSVEIPSSNEEKIGQIRELATKLNDLVEQVKKAQTIGSVDASQIDLTEQNLQEIESSANKLKLLAGKK
ncbi:MAG: hypothetical protein HY819_08180 [Acidobacteria bacterium]|nr:hypothetical protein [Acidobacteriota bacterium]